MGLLTPYLKKYWYLVLGSVICSSVGVYLTIQIPQILQRLQQYQMSGQEAGDAITDLGVHMVFLIAGYFAVQILSGFFSSRLSGYVSRDLRMDLFEKVQRMSSEDISGLSIPSLIVRLTNDVSNQVNFVSSMLQYIITAPLIIIFSMIMMFYSDVSWNLTIVVTVVSVAASVLIVMRRLAPMILRLRILNDLSLSSADDTVSGQKTVRQFNLNGLRWRHFDLYNTEIKEKNQRVLRSFIGVQMLDYVLINLMTLIVIWIGASIINAAGDEEGQMIVSKLVSVTIYAGMLAMQLDNLSAIYFDYSLSAVSIKRVGEVMDLDESISDGEGAQDVPVPPAIHIDHVTYAYPDAKHDAVSDLSLTVEEGKVTGIIGPTGSGKTTLLKLITRQMDPSRGSVRIGGTDLRTFRREQIYTLVSYCPQRPYLFNQSIRDNIRLDTYDSGNDDDIALALRRQSCSDFVDTTPEGLSAEITEFGRNYSGGQKQRLCLARALYKDSPVFILDDPTSALDAHTENIVRKGIQSVLEGRTAVFVSQKTDAMKIADTIAVMDGGRIVATGTYEQLLEECELFRTMHDAQHPEAVR